MIEQIPVQAIASMVITGILIGACAVLLVVAFRKLKS